MDQNRGDECHGFCEVPGPAPEPGDRDRPLLFPGPLPGVPLEDADAAIHDSMRAVSSTWLSAASREVASLPLADLFDTGDTSTFPGLTVYQAVAGPRRVLEDRQHQGVQILVDRAARGAEGFLGRGAHLQAALLELGGNCPQAERLHEGKGRLDLGIGGEVAAGIGRQVVRADRGRSRDDREPTDRRRREPTWWPRRSSGSCRRRNSSRVIRAPTRPRSPTFLSVATGGSSLPCSGSKQPGHLGNGRRHVQTVQGLPGFQSGRTMF